MSVHNIIRKAIRDNIMLQIDYNDGKKTTKRTYEPRFLFQWRTHYYVSGYCHLRSAIRVLKLSRVQKCKKLKDVSTTPFNILDALNRDQFSHLDIIVDAYSLDLKQELESLQIRLKENIIREYPKSVLFSKMQKSATLRSPLEEKVIMNMIDDPDVKLIEIEPFTIPYEFEGKSHNYVPDVLVHYQNGKKMLIEIKVSGDIIASKNQAKFQAAEIFCVKHEMIFSIRGVNGRSNSTYNSSWDEDEILIEEFSTNHTSQNFHRPTKKFQKNLSEKTKKTPSVYNLSEQIEYENSMLLSGIIEDFNLSCIQYDCSDCHGKGYLEGHTNGVPATIRCTGGGIIQLWESGSVQQNRQYLLDWTSYTEIRVLPPSKWIDDARLFTGRNPSGEWVELRVDDDPVVLKKPDKPNEYYFNVWDRPVGSDQRWEWVTTILAELKQLRNNKNLDS
ncbi:TnsA endonuclease N-terminal domain-containing protein (plasmid) [Paenibacillus sp. RS8]|uniref:TnsA endonuclease N-terminal domain-containing protein n=1 Tax=Paenibacillus sp. RS8 TaxID=3242681 RepID=UPI0035C03935